MSDRKDINEWEQTLLTSFLDMVRAADGDFGVLDRLAKTTIDAESFRLMVEHLSNHPQGKQAFATRKTLGAINLEQLSTLPEHTLGCLYAKHMYQNQLKPLVAPPIDSDYQYLATHITETHDIWHVVTGSTTDILGEIQLEAFCVAQFEFSRFWLALLAKNLLKSVVFDIESSVPYMDAITKGWLMGRQAKPLFGTDWQQLWATPLEEVRTKFNISI